MLRTTQNKQKEWEQPEYTVMNGSSMLHKVDPVRSMIYSIVYLVIY